MKWKKIVPIIFLIIFAIIVIPNIIKKLDNEEPVGEIKFSTDYIESQKIKATLTVNKEIETPEGWKKQSDLEYYKYYDKNEANIDNVILKNINNEKKSTMSINISKIVKKIPTLKSIKYLPEEPTQNYVKVVVKFDMDLGMDYKMNILDEWEGSNNGDTQERTFTQNYEGDFTFTDTEGNKVIVHVDVHNIDREPPEFEITKSIDEATNQSVEVTVTANEDVQVISMNEGWDFSENKIFKKTFEQSTIDPDVIMVKDLAGNTSTANIRIDNIDKNPPTITVNKSNERPTNSNVTVTISGNEALKVVSGTGWKLSTNELQLTKEYTANANETVIVSDYAGNQVTEHIVIDNIKKEEIIPTIVYDKEITNEDVLVTINTDRELYSGMNKNNWTLTNNNFSIQKLFTENSTETVDFIDIYGNTATATVTISNIDKTEPVIFISRGQNIGDTAYYTISADDAITVARSGINEASIMYAVTNSPEEPEQMENIENGTLITKDIVGIETYFLWVSCEDNLGNKSIKSYPISINDENNYSTKITYSNIDETIGSVVATITSNKELSYINDEPLMNGISTQGWKYTKGETQNEYKLEKEFRINTIQKIKLTEKSGLNKYIYVVIKNISTGLPGDVNENGILDINDIIALQRHIATQNSDEVLKQHPEWQLSEKSIQIGDINGNGIIDVVDIQIIQRHIAASNDDNISRDHPDWILIK